MYRAPRGTADVLPQEQPYWRYVEGVARDIARRFGYGRLDTPVFESSGLFVRGVGQVTDIIEKEMYTFEDRGGDHVALRPEGTAPVCRAYLEHGMRNLPQPVRLFYFCPIFRYDRPQAGRYRQHHQFGVEAIGDADPSVDAEVIELAWSLMSELGLKDLSLLVNSIGDANCRPAYLERLRSHYAARVEYLCNDCKLRLDRNPLRLLDCKQPACIEMALEAPRTEEHLCRSAGSTGNGCLATCARWAYPSVWNRGWCVAWTTTQEQSSRFSRLRKVGRPTYAAEAATTGWWSSWKAHPHPA